MKILLATDGSDCSERAAMFLARFNLRPEDEVLVVHVVTSIPFEDDNKAQILHFIKRVSPEIRKTSVDILRKTGAAIESREEEGSPDETILRIAQEENADLIVMGARGIRGIKSLFLGSVTRSVTAVSPIPLLVSRPSRAVGSGAMKVIFAADGSPASHATGTLLARMPFPRGTELMIMTVAHSAVSDIPERYAMEIQERMKDYVADVRRRSIEDAERVLREARGPLEGKFGSVTEAVKIGEPAAEILKEAESSGADLIAVGCRGLRGIRGILGSVSRRLLGFSPCPVLIGKLREETT